MWIVKKEATEVSWRCLKGLHDWASLGLRHRLCRDCKREEVFGLTTWLRKKHVS